jgi:hypothetical protein
MAQMTQAQARAYRQIIERAVESLTDEQALQAPMLFERWQPYTKYTAGKRLYHDGVLYTVLQAHTSQATWMPDVSPSLFARVLIPDPETIPDWVQPDSTNPYKKNDKARHNGKIWESTMDGNIWEPGVFGWVEYTG